MFFQTTGESFITDTFKGSFDFAEFSKNDGASLLVTATASDFRDTDFFFDHFVRGSELSAERLVSVHEIEV